MSPSEVAAVIRAHRFAYHDEHRLQEGIAAALAAAGVDAEREVHLDGRRRIDLIAGRVGIEVKVAGSSSSVARQVARYLESDRLDGIVLVTSRVRHLNVAELTHGKPVEVVCLAGSGL